MGKNFYLLSTKLLRLVCVLVLVLFSTNGVSAATADDAVFTMTPAEGQVTSLKTFKLSLANGKPFINMSMDDISIVVTNSWADTVATVAFPDLEPVVVPGPDDDPEMGMALPTAYIFSLSEEITALGTYTLNIPEYAFLDETFMPLPGVEFVYEVVEDSTLLPVMTPEAGSVTSLSEFVIGFSAAATINYNTSNRIQVFTRTQEMLAVIEPTDLESLGVNPTTFQTEFKFTLPTAITDEGIYIVSIPESIFALGEDKFNKSALYVYRIEPSVEESAFVTTPAAGKVSSLKDFRLSLLNGRSLVSSCNAELSITIVDANDVVVSTIAPDDMVAEVNPYTFNDPEFFSWAPSYFTFSLSEEIKTAGTYTMHIPAGAFMFGDTYDNCPEGIITYEIAPAVTIYAVSPAAGEVRTLKDFRLSLADGRTLVSSCNSEFPITIIDAEGVVVSTVAPDDMVAEANPYTYNDAEFYSWAPSYYTFSLTEEITTAGTYQMYIPAGAFMYGDNYDNCPEEYITFELKPTSISSIREDAQVVGSVFDVMGRKVTRLESGRIYLRDGKKFIQK